MGLTFRGLVAGLSSGPAVIVLLALQGSVAFADQAPQGKEGAAVVIDGVVREVFRSTRQSHVDYVVQIEVARSEYGRNPANARRAQAPAPGDQVYVHVFQSGENQERPGAGGHNAIPDERRHVRAYLYARPQGGWEGAYPDWYDAVNEPAVQRGPNDPEPPEGASPEVAQPSTTPAPSRTGSILQKLGLRAEQVKVSGRLVLKVLDVAPGSPAGEAGIEPGDAIIGVNNGFITDIEQLTEVINKSSPAVTLAVLNVRNGQKADVKVNVGGVAAASPSQPRPEPAPAPPRSLGIKTEQVRIGPRTAVRITVVQPGSPAEKAGIERGDVIVEAGGALTSDTRQLEAAIQSSGPVLGLKVRDTRTGREVPVQVHFEGPAATTESGPVPAPARPESPRPSAPTSPPPAGAGTSARALGLVLEAGTVDLLPVVKVVRVDPGSPAARAGIEPGDAIVGLNDKVIFAPDLFEVALTTAGPSFTLSVLDVKTGKKTPVKINTR
jgi:S1-C subfamily serine protease